ncbi:hypothetical protein GCM10023152_23280 [Agromyces bauzanensis]|uniref:Uncharacterized protein n=1 Tax=Agromyces bauzanensis TaxID=1308924 RepID=A0A917PGM7_9MICO|nr:hypothetical protein GCM10011372_12790 [Agromyces bauzanensis]
MAGSVGLGLVWAAAMVGTLAATLASSRSRGALSQLHAATAPGVRGGQFFGPDGGGERRGDVTEVRPSREAPDPSAAHRA